MLRLPEPDHRPLQNVALPLVVAQARFSSAHTELDGEMLSRFQFLFEEAGLHTPRVDPLQLNQVIVGPSPEPVMSRTNGYQLISADGECTVTITSDSIALETPSFKSYAENFGPRWHQVVAVATEILSPVTLTRAGLRFVNVLHVPQETTGGEWGRWLHPPLVAALYDAWLSEGTLAFSQQIQLDLGGGVRCGMRSGPVERGKYLLDLDNYLESGAIWSLDRVMQEFDSLNSRGVAAFQAMISTEMLEVLRGEYVGKDGTDE